MNEVVLKPRVNCHFELYAVSSGFTFLQNIVDGSQPIVIFNSLNKSLILQGLRYS